MMMAFLMYDSPAVKIKTTVFGGSKISKNQRRDFASFFHFLKEKTSPILHLSS